MELAILALFISFEYLKKYLLNFHYKSVQVYPFFPILKPELATFFHWNKKWSIFIFIRKKEEMDVMWQAEWKMKQTWKVRTLKSIHPEHHPSVFFCMMIIIIYIMMMIWYRNDKQINLMPFIEIRLVSEWCDGKTWNICKRWMIHTNKHRWILSINGNTAHYS